MKLFALQAAIALTLLAACPSGARAQSPGNYRAAPTTPFLGGSAPLEAGRSNPALNYFAGPSVTRVAARPRAAETLPPPQPAPVNVTTKPFSNLRSGPVISPYLLLDNRESATGVPLYYSLVRPQLDQIQYNQKMQAEYGRMQQQLRAAAPGGNGSQASFGGVPTTGHGTQFMNLGGYYSHPQR